MAYGLYYIVLSATITMRNKRFWVSCFSKYYLQNYVFERKKEIKYLKTKIFYYVFKVIIVKVTIIMIIFYITNIL